MKNKPKQQTPPAPLPEDTDKTATLYARVPTAVHSAARIQAFREGRPVAELVAEAVTRYLTETNGSAA